MWIGWLPATDEEQETRRRSGEQRARRRTAHPVALTQTLACCLLGQTRAKLDAYEIFAQHDFSSAGRFDGK